VNEWGGRWSANRTSPSKVPLIEATPACTVDLNVSGPVCSSRWQPGMVRTSTAGSVSAS
jgi:hypothetical protein